MFTSAFPARRSATRISSYDTGVDLISPASGNPTATRWSRLRNSNSIIRHSSDRPRCRIAVARPRASFTPRTVFTPATRYDSSVFLGKDTTIARNTKLLWKFVSICNGYGHGESLVASVQRNCSKYSFKFARLSDKR